MFQICQKLNLRFSIIVTYWLYDKRDAYQNLIFFRSKITSFDYGVNVYKSFQKIKNAGKNFSLQLQLYIFTVFLVIKSVFVIATGN